MRSDLQYARTLMADMLCRSEHERRACDAGSGREVQPESTICRR